MVPSFMNMIPSFMVMDSLGWIDTHRALYLPGAASAFGIFLMRQFITASVPKAKCSKLPGSTAAARSASTGASPCR